MPHVSRKTLTGRQRAALVSEFSRTMKKSGHRERVLQGLLTATEALMLAKRFAAIVMLAREVPPYRIHRSLGITQTTVARLARAHDRGAYSEIAAFVERQKGRERFWSNLELFLQAGLPPHGRGRWKWLYKDKKMSERMSERK